jgi:ketosteroid isomerase-like protein
MRIGEMLGVLSAGLLMLLPQIMPTGPSHAVLDGPAIHSNAGTAPAKTAEDLAKIREQWVNRFSAKQLDAVMELYAPDAVFLTGGGDRITGAPAIRQLIKGAMDRVTVDLRLQSMKIEESGKLGYDSGDFTETMTLIATGKKYPTRGCYLMIFKRQPDGKWRILEHAWAGKEPDMK